MLYWDTFFGTNTKGSNKTEPNNKNTLRDGEVAKFNEYINDLTNVKDKLNKLNIAHKFNWIQPEIDTLTQLIDNSTIIKDNLTTTQPITGGGTRKKRKNRKHKKHKKKTLKH